ncbi:hypothetical protein [Actinomadura sp. HBU206391]|uniref:hypothetical protein n=1 Tax=Actinomadura sp. HBU206391 TaxID=2731692 RepID=UPI0016504036|nr:hypothetical protein [Actinomadura sp. HBU206391]MBC6461735.1 hypothetical protein [Actinomadura sp. HBU206391]
MIGRLNALGDRMLGLVLPSASASADICPGAYIGRGGSCEYYCYRWRDRSARYRSCDGGPCQITCYDCC